MPACGGIKEALSSATRASRRHAAVAGRAACRPSRIILSNTRQMQSEVLENGSCFCISDIIIFLSFCFALTWGLLRLSENQKKGEWYVSQLRLIRTAQDAAAYRKILLARYYHGQPLIFLTLTFLEELPKGKRNPYKLKLQALMNFLRKKWSVEYFAVQTNEGRQVFHLAMICPYIHHSVIRKWWRENTGAWNICISREKNLPAFLSEMTGQYEIVRYSMSKNFIPKGSLKPLKALKNYFQGKQLNEACMMYGRRLKDSSIDESYNRTVSCIERGYGSYSLLPSKKM